MCAAVAVLLLYAADLTDRAAAVVRWYGTPSLRAGSKSAVWLVCRAAMSIRLKLCYIAKVKLNTCHFRVCRDCSTNTAERKKKNTEMNTTTT